MELSCILGIQVLTPAEICVYYIHQSLHIIYKDVNTIFVLLPRPPQKLSSGTLRRGFCHIPTDVTDMLTASIIRATAVICSETQRQV
jgi:hypothetical protein